MILQFWTYFRSHQIILKNQLHFSIFLFSLAIFFCLLDLRFNSFDFILILLSLILTIRKPSNMIVTQFYDQIGDHAAWFMLQTILIRPPHLFQQNRWYQLVFRFHTWLPSLFQYHLVHCWEQLQLLLMTELLRSRRWPYSEPRFEFLFEWFTKCCLNR